MKKNKAEELLSQAVENTTPDVFDSILSACPEKTDRDNIVAMDEIKASSNNKKKNDWVKRVVAAAAAFAVVVGCSIGFGTYQKAHAAECFVSIDAGGAVTVGVNDENVVVSVGDNSTGVTAGDVKGENITDAAKTIVGKMVDDGQITADNNVVLVSVERLADKNSQTQETPAVTDDLEKELQDAAERHEEGVRDVQKEIDQELADAIHEILSSRGIDADIIGQKFASEDAIGEIAKEFSISDGKASFIRRLVDSNTSGDGTQISDLAGKTISEIVKYASAWLTGSDDTESAQDDTGTSSGINVKVGSKASVSVGGSSASGSAGTHVEADNGSVKVDVGGSSAADFSLGIEVDGNKFTYDNSDPAGSIIGIVGSIIKAS